MIIPCYNEEAAIGRVVSDLKQTLPQATIYVYDNNSTDNTASEAKAAGAV
ncbi:glycosyltransferase, partial [Aerococcus urinae]